MKTYQIQDGFVAAHNPEQAIGTWAEYFDMEDPKEAGPCVEVDPAKVVVHFEEEDGSFKPGTLSDLMYEGMEAQVLLDGEND